MSRSERRRPHPALIWTWAVVTIVAGPALIVSQFVAGLGSFAGPGSTPVADALIPIAAFASLLGGVGALVIGGRWWTALLCASPGVLQLLLQLLTDSNDPLANLVFLMMLASPIAAIIGVLFAVAHANEAAYGPDEEVEEAEENGAREIAEPDA